MSTVKRFKLKQRFSFSTNLDERESFYISVDKDGEYVEYKSFEYIQNAKRILNRKYINFRKRHMELMRNRINAEIVNELINNEIIKYDGGDELKTMREAIRDEHIVSILKGLQQKVNSLKITANH